VSLDLVIFDVLVPSAGIELLNSKSPGFKELYKEEVICSSSLSTLHSTPKLLIESEILKPHSLLNQSIMAQEYAHDKPAGFNNRIERVAVVGVSDIQDPDLSQNI
jgi:hypothetical protein